jgi:molybdopterin-guanine dinucleotide biosynthesis protein A
MPLASPASITGIVLAGGQGSRMGGADKGLVELHGLPLIEHVLGRLAPQVAGVIVSANRNLDFYRAVVPRVVPDAGPPGAYRGPLAGMRAGLAAAPTAWAAFVPCDMPQLPRDLVGRLAEAVNARGVRAAVARSQGRLQPVVCLLSTSLLASLDEHLAGGGAAVHRWLDAMGAVPVDFDDPLAFRNINTNDALQAGRR